MNAELLYQQGVARFMRLPIPAHLDHRPDGSGLDDGPYLPDCTPRKPISRKSPEEHAATRAKAWATRRAKYGKDGHR